MDYVFFDLLHKELNPSQADFDKEKYSNIFDLQNQLESLLDEKDKELVASFRIKVVDYQDDFWAEICNKLIKRSILLGMEIQKYIDEIEYY